MCHRYCMPLSSKSSLTLSIHLFLCLPLLLSPLTCPCSAACGRLFPSILSSCPNHVSLLLLIFSITVSSAPSSSHSFIYSFRLFLYCVFKSTTTHWRSRHNTDSVLEFHTEAPQATVSEGLAQGPYMAARLGVEAMTLRTKDVDSINAPTAPHTSGSSLVFSFLILSLLHLPLILLNHIISATSSLLSSSFLSVL